MVQVRYIEQKQDEAFVRLLHTVSLDKKSLQAYEVQADPDVLKSNPAYILELLSTTAADNLCLEFYREFGDIGKLWYQPTVPPTKRNRESFKFFINVRPQLLERLNRKQITRQLTSEIYRLVKQYPNLQDLLTESENKSISASRIRLQPEPLNYV
jgi:hypothetical protein